MLYGIGVTKSSRWSIAGGTWKTSGRAHPTRGAENQERGDTPDTLCHRGEMKQTRGRCKSRAASVNKVRVLCSRSRPFIYLREREVGFELEWLLSLARVHGSACCRSRVKKNAARSYAVKYFKGPTQPHAARQIVLTRFTRAVFSYHCGQIVGSRPSIH